MAKPGTTKSEITFGERLATAVVCALVMGVMTVCVPIGLVLVGTRGRGLNMLAIFGSFHIWGISLVIVAGICGAVLGADRAATLFGYFWETEEPKRPEITAALWLAVIGIAVASYFIFGKHHSL